MSVMQLMYSAFEQSLTKARMRKQSFHNVPPALAEARAAAINARTIVDQRAARKVEEGKEKT